MYSLTILSLTVCVVESLADVNPDTRHGFCFLLGDGGNDVSMIQEADCGVGVEGKVRLSPSQRLSLTCRSDRFSLCVSWQDLSHVQRDVEGPAHRWFLCMGIYCLSKGNKDDRMLFCSSKSKSLSSARSVALLSVGFLSKWLLCSDTVLLYYSNFIMYLLLGNNYREFKKCIAY